MAKRISAPTGPHLRRRYPWHEWMDGSWWEIERGEDFTVPVRVMQSILRAHALVKSPWFCELRFPEDGPASGRTRIQFRFVPREEVAP